MKLDILTPKKTFFSGEVDSVTLPGTLGVFTLLPGHAPMISSLRSGGEITYAQESKRNTIVTGGGFVEVWRNRVTICIDIIEETAATQEPKKQP
ncbi:MAG: ATP synthase F1 subunit epsilon [Prevotellaceae bacterium]|jgi:F-type H+-transporting ATPase subunit epsilon|nr:ATP synthase F1 subunit epsilon [Prevotellaceae bacterium]